MAFTVDAAFTTFFDKINLSGDHRQIANSRRDRIVQLLEKEFEILDAFSTGSVPRFTALRSRADLDVIVVLHSGKHIQGKSPATLLSDVQDALSGYAARVRKNGQAVTLTFKTWPSVDIVPVGRVVKLDGSFDHYSVPNANRGIWIASRPESFSSEIGRKATLCGENFRRIIKMIKHWNYTHSEYLTGYHIEAMGIRTFDQQLNDVPWNVLQFFTNARHLLATPLWHDLSFADAYLNDRNRDEVCRRLDGAIDLARTAWYETYGGRTNHAGAISLWKQLFGDEFPSYG